MGDLEDRRARVAAISHLRTDEALRLFIRVFAAKMWVVLACLEVLGDDRQVSRHVNADEALLDAASAADDQRILIWDFFNRELYYGIIAPDDPVEYPLIFAGEFASHFSKVSGFGQLYTIFREEGRAYEFEGHFDTWRQVSYAAAQEVLSFYGRFREHNDR